MHSVTAIDAASTPCHIEPVKRVHPTLLLACALCLLACGSSDEDTPLPTISSSAAGVDWPASPSGVSAGLEACVRDYRGIASAGLPSREEGQSFDAWYAGAFQSWTRSYNTVRERCDPISHALDQESPAAQQILAAQSYMHERVGHEAEAYDEAPQMFIMSRYWLLGAACTYQSCEAGGDQRWARFCAQRAERLPPCPPVEPAPTEPPELSEP